MCAADHKCPADRPRRRPAGLCDRTALSARVRAVSHRVLRVRRHSMHELKEALRAGAGERLLLTGPAGSGKSVALVSLVEWARAQGW